MTGGNDSVIPKGALGTLDVLMCRIGPSVPGRLERKYQGRHKALDTNPQRITLPCMVGYAAPTTVVGRLHATGAPLLLSHPGPCIFVVCQ